MIIRTGFRPVLENGISGMGLPRESPLAVEFPIPMFDPSSDLTPVEKNIDKIIYALTEWRPKTRSTGLYNPPKIKIKGRDYPDALERLNLMFLKNKWSDASTLLPATEKAVKNILRGTDLPANTKLGSIMPRGGIASVEDCAVALAMVGGRPEYLPVLIASVQAICQPRFLFQQVNASTCPMVPAIVVNGPVAKQIRLSSGYGAMGPDPNRPAAAKIGRAQRLIQMNLGGAIPGMGTMANFGPQRAINAVLAEDEEGIPEGWGGSLAEERSFDKNTNALTVVQVSGWTNVALSGGDSKVAEERVREYLNRLAYFMGTPSLNNWGYTSRQVTDGIGVSRAIFQPYTSRADDPEYTAGLVLITRGWAAELVKYGWTKETVKEYLWEHSKLPWDTMLKAGLSKRALLEDFKEGEPCPIVRTPKGIMIAIAGGEQSGHGFWMQPGNAYRPASQEILLPKCWEQLLKEAEKDLGPLPRIR